MGTRPRPYSRKFLTLVAFYAYFWFRLATMGRVIAYSDGLAAREDVVWY